MRYNSLVGGFAAILTFLPRISISPSDPPDLQDIFSASFTITNTNFIPLRDVSASVAAGNILLGDSPPNVKTRSNEFNLRLQIPDWTNHNLDIDEKFAITPQDVINFPKSPSSIYADIGIVVTYKPWFLPFHREKIFRFVTHRQNDHLYWYSAPVN
jgi:hypothetical protein